MIPLRLEIILNKMPLSTTVDNYPYTTKSSPLNANLKRTFVQQQKCSDLYSSLCHRYDIRIEISDNNYLLHYRNIISMFQKQESNYYGLSTKY